MRQIDQIILAIDVVDVAVVRVSPSRRLGVYQFESVAAVLKLRSPRHNYALRAEVMSPSKMRTELVIGNVSPSIIAGVIVPHPLIRGSLTFVILLLWMILPLWRRLLLPIILLMHLILPPHLVLLLFLLGRLGFFLARGFGIVVARLSLVLFRLRSCVVLLRCRVVIFLFFVLCVKQSRTSNQYGKDYYIQKSENSHRHLQRHLGNHPAIPSCVRSSGPPEAPGQMLITDISFSARNCRP